MIVLALIAMGLGAGIYGAYEGFGEQARRRFDSIVVNSGRPVCVSGLYVPPLITFAEPRILNNRDEWAANTPEEINRYFGCRVVITDRTLHGAALPRGPD